MTPRRHVPSLRLLAITLVVAGFSVLLFCSLRLKTIGWLTYSNTIYRFQLSYPPTAHIFSTFEPEYTLSDSWRQVSLSRDNTTHIGSSEGLQLVDIAVDRTRIGDDYLHADLRIGESTSTEDVNECLGDTERQSLQAVPPSETINGIRFVRAASSLSVMSQSATIHSYRTVHDGACVSLEAVVTASHAGGLPDDTYAQHEAEDFDVLDKVIETFHFEKE